jgi:flagellar assembly protein FliH
LFNNIRHNVLRAVKVLPDAVRVGVIEVDPLEDEGAHEEGKQENEIDLAQDKINRLESQIRLLTNRLEEAAKNYDELSSRCEKLEHDLENRKTELQTEMQRKLESERAVVVDKAKAEASSILKEAGKIHSEASEKGHSEGLLKGQKEGLEKTKADLEAEYSSRFSGFVDIFEKIHSEIEKNFNDLVQLNEARLLRLWKETLLAMLHREVALNPETARIVLEGILERVSDKNRILIYLSPLDVENIRSQTDKMTESLRGVKHLEFLADLRVEQGSCIVETNLGIYDARWRTQMEQIETQIADLYRDITKESAVETTKSRRKKKSAEKGVPKE